MTPPENMRRQSPQPGDTPREMREKERVILSSAEVAARIQKEIQATLIERYQSNRMLEEHGIAYWVEAIAEAKKSGRPDPDYLRDMEWERYKNMQSLWKAKALCWLAQDVRLMSVRWKEVPPASLSQKERDAIAEDALREFRADKGYIEGELRKETTEKSLTAEEFEGICNHVRDDFLYGEVERQEMRLRAPETKPQIDPQDILANFMHFSDMYHLCLTRGESKFVRYTQVDGVSKRIDFLHRNPFTVFHDHGATQDFFIHTVDEKDLKKVLRTEKISLPFASAKKEYEEKSDDTAWEARRKLIRDLLTTPFEGWRLYAILMVTNFFRFHRTTKSDAKTVASFPFEVKELYEDRVVNHRFFLERLFDLLWSKQEGGVTADECTEIVTWFRNNKDLFTEATPEEIEEFVEGNRLLAEKGVHQNQDGIYCLPHASYSSALRYPMYIFFKYSCKGPKRGWVWCLLTRRQDEKEDAYQVRSRNPDAYVWGRLGPFLVGSYGDAFSNPQNRLKANALIHAMRSVRWRRWDAHVPEFVRQLSNELDHEKVQELERGMRFFNQIIDQQNLNLHKDGSITVQDNAQMLHLYSFQKETGIWSFDHSVFQFKFDSRAGWMWGVTDKNEILVENNLEYRDGVDRLEWYPLKVNPSRIFVDKKKDGRRPLSSVVGVFDCHVAKMRFWSAPPKKAPERKQQ